MDCGLWYRLSASFTVLYGAEEGGYLHDRTRITGNVYPGTNQHATGETKQNQACQIPGRKRPHFSSQIFHQSAS